MVKANHALSNSALVKGLGCGRIDSLIILLLLRWELRVTGLSEVKKSDMLIT